MPTFATSQPIIAVTGEDDRYLAVRRRAIDLASEERRAVILYDIDAAGLFASPVPTAWSGDGERELMEEEAGPAERLEPDDLDLAGRPTLAAQVRSLRDRGIEAWGWLPTRKDAADLAAYADRHQASRVLVPRDLAEPGLVGRIIGREGAAEAQAETGVPFELVDGTGAGRR